MGLSNPKARPEHPGAHMLASALACLRRGLVNKHEGMTKHHVMRSKLPADGEVSQAVEIMQATTEA